MPAYDGTMHPAELSILLHRALELRLDRLEALMGPTDWVLEGDGLHRVRVASRRVRAVLDLVDPDLYPAFKRQSRRLQALTELLGPSREWDVHVARLETLGPQLSGPGAWAALEHALEGLERQRAKARKRVIRELGQGSFAGLRKLREVPLLPNPFLPGDPHRAAWDGAEARSRACLALLPAAMEREDVSALHGFRIAVKKLRYTLEVLGEAFEVDLGEALSHLRRIQGALGDHHDLALLEAHLWGLHEGLQARRRPVLAEGILDLLGLVAESRRGRFDAFREAVQILQGEAFLDRLRAAFGLPSRDGNAP